MGSLEKMEQMSMEIQLLKMPRDKNIQKFFA